MNTNPNQAMTTLHLSPAQCHACGLPYGLPDADAPATPIAWYALTVRAKVPKTALPDAHYFTAVNKGFGQFELTILDPMHVRL